MCDLLIDIVCMNCASQRMIQSHETHFFSLSSSFVEGLVINSFSGQQILEFLYA